ncbi:hypothetical protein [Mucilaginibacter flavidus]|uniref:hypothetical protein n=1 Tax=Mucilaginibacter flavidus TaxID=2949309 RepID=UPI00209244B1|nr:hypothetical protein [Mucilaginibacter flavidus]MCO5946839.1 hypothetical protein [Mucilaginibacter flavidus]
MAQFYSRPWFSVCKACSGDESWAEEITTQASSRAAVEMRNTCYRTNQLEELKQISIPVLLLHGDKNASCPSFYGKRGP